MTHYSPIGPIKILRQLQEHNILGDYLLLLAHDVLDHPQEYVELIDTAQAIHDDEKCLFIIMDNGVIERGEPVSLPQLLEATDLVGADVVVGPDVVGDFFGTKKLMMDQGDKIRRDYPMMFVPQGGCLDEIFQCIDWYTEKFPEITSGDAASHWGIPRWIANEVCSRQVIVQDIVAHDERAQIHLLGMSHRLDDDITSAKHPNVMGIDSANPLVLGHQGIPILPNTIHMPRGDYWEASIVNEIMMQNVRWVRDALNNGS